MIRLCSGLGPSLRWDDEYLRVRAAPISKLMIENWNKIVPWLLVITLSESLGLWLNNLR